MSRVIVGVDGSSVAHDAMVFAVREARMRNALLEVVHVRPPVHAASSIRGAEYASPAVLEQLVEADRQRAEEAERHAREAAEHLLAGMVEQVDTDGVSIEQTSVVDRRPARRLVELVGQRGDVELLVVGSRGRGELTGMLLGSVSLACVTHASVPVTVVHATAV